MIDKGCELFAELRGVLLAQVDFVLCAVDPEPHGLIRTARIQIIFQRDNCSSCHPNPP
jgi:cytochrome c551/c552